MQRMTGADASMLYSETPTSHMHTMKVAVLDVAGVKGAYDRDRLVDEVEARIHLMEPLRRRAVDVPLGLHHPVWVEDPDFVVAHHIRERVVSAPGDQRALDSVLSEIHSEPLDRSRPLWEMTFISGLADGRIAVAAKIHHAVADGMASMTGLMHLASFAMDEPVPPPSEEWLPESIPLKRELLYHALLDRLRAWGSIPELILRTIQGVSRMRKVRKTVEATPPNPLTGPRASFNGNLTRRRSVATIKTPLADFKVIKTAFDCTINDVVLASTAGGLRRYLDRRGEQHAKPLVCAIPTALDAGSDNQRRSGNKVSQFFTSLNTHIDDPVERLQRIHAVTKTAKLLNAEMGPELAHDWNEFSSPGPYQLLWRRVMPKVGTPAINVVVSNVPGPRDSLWFAGAHMDDFYSTSVLTEGAGLNITVWSYKDHMRAGITSCPELIRDLHELADDIEAAFDELLELARSSTVA
nr:putative wax ester synthase/acyl-CoA:diacylglycerol acyltransferase [uncultured bacterium]